MDGMMDVLINLKPQIDPIITFTKLIAFLMGVILFIDGGIKLARVGEAGHQVRIGGVLGQFAVAAALIGLFTHGDSMLIGVTDTSLYGQGTAHIMGYQTKNELLDAKSRMAMDAGAWIINFVGYIAIINGLLILNDNANGRQRKSWGQGAMHIFAGGLCANFSATVDLVMKSAGMGS